MEDLAASSGNPQDEEEMYLDEQMGSVESDKMHTQLPKRRRPQRQIKSTARVTNRGLRDRIHHLENVIMEISARLPPRQPEEQYEELPMESAQQ